MPTTLPETGHRGSISVNDVRHFLMDRGSNDNTLDLDLSFSDEEIQYAMRFAALSYNDIPPNVHNVTALSMPFAGLFLHGISYHLYLSKLQKLIRNDFDYTAGNASVSLNTRRISHLKEMLPLFKKEFEEKAHTRKVTKNLEAAYQAY